MVQSKAGFQRSYVDDHIDQTYLVSELLNKGVVDYGDIEGWNENEEGEYPEIYQWKVFPKFSSFDHEKLIKAEIPVLRSEYETWIGLTQFGSPYDLSIYPELLNILFVEHADQKYKKLVLR